LPPWYCRLASLLARASSQAPTDLTDHDSQATPGCKKRSIRRARNLFDRAHARFRLKNYRGNRRKMDVWRVFPAGRPVRSHVDDDIDAYTSCPVQAGRAGRHVLVGGWPSYSCRQSSATTTTGPARKERRTYASASHWQASARNLHLYFRLRAPCLLPSWERHRRLNHLPVFFSMASCRLLIQLHLPFHGHPVKSRFSIDLLSLHGCKMVRLVCILGAS
jgi:hypothetical protein